MDSERIDLVCDFYRELVEQANASNELKPDLYGLRGSIVLLHDKLGRMLEVEESEMEGELPALCADVFGIINHMVGMDNEEWVDLPPDNGEDAEVVPKTGQELEAELKEFQ